MLEAIARWKRGWVGGVAVGALLAAGTAAAQSTHVDGCAKTRQRLQLGAQWIIRAQKADGLFTYEYLPRMARETEDNNIVRQLGTFWALVRANARHPTAESRAAIEAFRAGIAPYVIESKADDKAIAFVRYDGLGKLNAAALYTIALVDMAESGIVLNRVEARILPKLVRGMRLMESGDGGFWYIYYLPKKDNVITAYGTGEALYALAKYYGHQGDEAGVRWVYKTFRTYYQNYFKPIPDFEESHVKGFFSWGIAALREIQRTIPIDYHAYVRPLLREAMQFRAHNSVCAHQGCIISKNTTDAVFLEGMLIGYGMARAAGEDAAMAEDMRRYIEAARRHILSRQLVDDRGLPGKPEQFLGGFCDDAQCNYMRNDITQHAMMALDRYLDRFCTPDAR